MTNRSVSLALPQQHQAKDMSIKSPIFGMFGRSPIKPLEEHMRVVLQCARNLIPFYEAVMAQDFDAMCRERDNIASLENEADHLKQDLRLHLPKSLFLPVPRGDILQILTMQDRIANKAKDIAGLMVGRKMTVPQEIAAPLMQLITRSVDAASQAESAINELDQLLESSFRGNEVTIVENMIIELDRIEHDTDEMQIEVRQLLFSIESELPPVDVMFLYQIIMWAGDLADCAQAVGRQLQLLLAR